MHSHTLRSVRSRHLVFVAALATLGACSTATTPVDASGGDAPAPGDGGPVGDIEIGLRGDGAVFTPWHDGDTIPLMWGPQGGVMVTPAVAIDGALVSGVDPTLEVQLENLDPATGMPLASFPGYGPVRAIFARLDRRLVNGPIFDQLGWTDMTGTHLRLRAHVRGTGLDLTGEVEIVLGSAGAMPPPPDCTDAMPCFDGTGDGGLVPRDVDAAASPDAGLDGG